MRRDKGEERREGCLLCFFFSSFESERVDEGEGESLLSFFTQMKRFVFISCRILAFYPNTFVPAFYYNIQD